MPDRGPAVRVSVVVGVDGSGRTHRLQALTAAGDLPPLRLRAPLDAPDLAERLVAAADRPALVVVDDVHLLADDALDVLTRAVRAGTPVLVSRRPTLDRTALAALDEALAATGDVDVLTPMDVGSAGPLVTASSGRPCPPDRAQALVAATGGWAALVAALAPLPDEGAPPAGLVARVQRRLTAAGPAAQRVARVLAVGAEGGDAVLADAADVPPDDLPEALRALRDAGLLDPAGERLVPVVAAALLADLPAAALRRVHEDVARALAAAGAPPEATAERLRAARARGPEAAAAYRAAGEAVRYADPQAALGWYDEALEAGAAPSTLAAGRAEAALLLGLAADPDAGPPDGPDADRLAVVGAVVTARAGRAGAAADALLACPPPGPLLAVPLLVADGRPGPAAEAAGSPGPVAVRLAAAAALAAADPAAAVPAAIDAAEAAERTPPAVVLPDTPHAFGAVLAVVAGDAGTAVELLERAARTGTGGPASASRHRLLMAWARLRSGRPDLAAAELAQVPVDPEPDARDRLLHAAVTVGLARRSGDVGRLRDAWPAVERVLARGGLDLLALEPAEELAVAAARLRRSHRAEAALAGVEAAVTGLGDPPAWRVALGWLRLQVAVASDDAAAAAEAAAAVCAPHAAGHRQRAQQDAARCWAAALAGDVDPAAVTAAAEALADAELPWEGGRLAGDAALRVPDAVAARRLLERARDLAVPEPAVTTAAGGGAPDDAAARAGLSEREVEVSRLVLAGRTHREIGAQLYIAPKTVEHHVARIRTKLGATTRAEFVAALRGLLGPDPGADPRITPP